MRILAPFIALVFISVVLNPLVAPGLGIVDPDAPCAVPIELDGVGPACPLGDGHYIAWFDDGTTYQTHGPDPIPAGGDEAFPASVQERDPRCATDWYQHVLSGYPANGENRYDEVVEYIRQQMRKMNWILNEDALASGGVTADYKVRCDVTGDIRVDAFVVPSSSNDFSAVVNAARNAGFRSSIADFTIFYDASHSAYCGVGTIAWDERLSEDNNNNRGGGYGLTYRNCWGGRTPMHENGHNQGAVQRTAPMSDGSGHCLEGYDIMCYPTSSFLVLCPGRFRFDCNYDTYFNADPAPGSWLAENWNIGSRLNRFIAFGDTDPPPLNDPPIALFDVTIDGLNVTFDASASFDPDDDPLYYLWDLGDGTTATEEVFVHTYDGPGRYTVTLDVFDGHGGKDRATTRIVLGVATDPRTEVHAFDGRIGCSIAFAPITSNDLCQTGDATNTFAFPIEPGVTTLYAHLSWDDTALGAANEMSYSWQRPPGTGTESGTTPVTSTHPVSEDSNTHLFGTTGQIQVRGTGNSGLILDGAFSLCVAVVYGGAEPPSENPCAP